MSQPTDWFSKLSYLMLETNSTCNLKCVTCSREQLVETGMRHKKLMSEKELRFILDQVRECPIDTIKFEGLSEPMMHPQFADLSAILRSYFPRAFVIIATNLQYRVEKSPLLATLPFVDMVYLSIDGVGETYETQRLGASYEKLLKSLEELDKHVSHHDRHKLFINFTLTPENYRDLEEVYGLKAEFGLAGVRINLAQNWVEGEANSHAFIPDILNYVQNFQRDVKGVAGWDYQHCFWPFTGTVIDVFGNVRQCVINTTQKPLGNVFQMPLREIFNNNPILTDARRLLESNCAPEQCRTCDYKNLSPHLAKVLGGEFRLNRPRPVDHANSI